LKKGVDTIKEVRFNELIPTETPNMNAHHINQMQKQAKNYFAKWCVPIV